MFVLLLVLCISFATFVLGHFRLGKHGNRYVRNTARDKIEVFVLNQFASELREHNRIGRPIEPNPWQYLPFTNLVSRLCNVVRG
jgi:hypothetical protein